MVSTASGIWEPLSPLMISALDDPQRGLIVIDPHLRLQHITTAVQELLALHDGFLWKGHDLTGFLSQSDLDPTSLASCESAIVEALNGRSVDPVRLFSGDKWREIRMQVRSIGQEHLVVTLDVVNISSTTETSTGDTSSRDGLTNLFNRSHFETLVCNALAPPAKANLAIVLVDLDRFKPVNDSLGHAAGDALLRLAGQRLQSVVRATDSVARLGGDEFALMIHPLAPAADAGEIARRIVDLIARTYLIEGHLVNIGASVGIALAPQNGVEYETLFRRADLALYCSKTTGRGTHHFFSQDMEIRAQVRRTSELDLRRALALRQLEVHYQAQVDVQTHHLLGFEALVRWNHPQWGMVPPADFLPLAEEIGVIIPIGEWVLKTACAEAMNWPDHVTIAVNASPVQFETGRFGDCVRRALAGTNLRAGRLEIEITEGILLRDEKAVLATLAELRSMGVRVAIDDFGTGYASLSQLARFSFDKIKIDRSLVGEDGENPKNRAIVRAICGLGASLGVTTIAEGVETSGQLDRIQRDGCGSVQGYLFSKPAPASQLEKLIEELKQPNEIEL